MKLKCRCGHLLDLSDADAGRTVRCTACGRAYRVSRDARGKLSAWALKSPKKAPQPTAGTDTRGGPTAPTAGAAESRSWWYYLATSWAYPLRGSAKWTLLLWMFLTVFVAPFVMFIPLIGLLFPFVMLGLLTLYEFSLIRQSSYDAEAVPSLPQWDDVYESALRPLGQLVAVMIGSGLPFFVLAAPGLFLRMPPWWAQVTTASLVLACFLVPINVLAVATADHIGAVNPKFTFPAIWKVPLAYVVCSAFCALCWRGGSWTSEMLSTALGGRFVGAFVGLGAWLYLVTVAARALGTLHYAHSDRIGWMK